MRPLIWLTGLLLSAALLMGAVPRHRRFMQPNLAQTSAGTSCTPATGGPMGAEWTLDHGLGVADPARTDAYALSPGCVVDADRFIFPATTTSFSAALNATLCTGSGAHSLGCWVKGTSGSGTIDNTVLKGGFSSADCNYVSTAFTWCERENIAAGAITGWYLGNMSQVNGGTERPENDIVSWGCRCEEAATISP